MKVEAAVFRDENTSQHNDNKTLLSHLSGQISGIDKKVDRLDERLDNVQVWQFEHEKAHFSEEQEKSPDSWYNDGMPVEIFDEEMEPTTKLNVAVYNDKGIITPAWWLEIQERGYYDMAEINAILDCIPNIIDQLTRLMEYFDEP